MTCLVRQLIDVSRQLFDQINAKHILYKKCDEAATDKTTQRKILKEETGVLLKHPPTRPAMDCQVGPSYFSRLMKNWIPCAIIRTWKLSKKMVRHISVDVIFFLRILPFLFSFFIFNFIFLPRYSFYSYL